MSENEQTKAKLLALLKELERHPDPEEAHVLADEYLLCYIDDPRVRRQFQLIKKFYG